MKHLILLANPNPQSFCHAIAARIAATAHRLGHEALVRDLYAEDFRAILSAEDLQGFFRGQLPDDVARAQSDIREADIIHMVYPIWWTGLPAMLKGYVDRVLAPGFAYQRNGPVIEPLLKGKKGFLWTPHGNTQAEYEGNGMFEALQKTSDDGILRYVGIEVLAHEFLSDIRRTTPEGREAWLNRLEEKMMSHLAPPPFAIR